MYSEVENETIVSRSVILWHCLASLSTKSLLNISQASSLAPLLTITDPSIQALHFISFLFEALSIGRNREFRAHHQIKDSDGPNHLDRGMGSKSSRPDPVVIAELLG